MSASKITGCDLPGACLRTILSACINGKPASIAVASSRIKFDISDRDRVGRRGPKVIQLGKVIWVEPMDDSCALADFIATGRAIAVGASSDSIFNGVRPRLCTKRSADARSDATTTPLASAPLRSSPSYRHEAMLSFRPLPGLRA